MSFPMTVPLVKSLAAVKVVLTAEMTMTAARAMGPLFSDILVDTLEAVWPPRTLTE